MHEFWKFRGWMADSSHIDWITSPGATIHSSHKMWQMDYRQENRAQHVFVVADLRNGLGGESIDTIMEHINLFYKDVREQAKAFHQENGQTFSFAMRLYPSKIVWLDGDCCAFLFLQGG